MSSIANMILDLILLHFYVIFIFSVFSNNINDVSNSDVDNSDINAAIEYLIANTNFISSRISQIKCLNEVFEMRIFTNF